MSLRNKLFGVAVAASMVTGTVIPAMAATITIENAQPDITYDAYKIFDIDHNGTTSDPTYQGYAYTIDSTNPWEDAVRTYATSHPAEITLEGAAKDDNLFVVELKEQFDAVTFGAHLETYITAGHSNYNASITPVSDSVDAANIIGVEKAGYYLVHATNGLNSLAVLVNSTEDKIIVDKNKHSITKTFADGSREEFVAIGDPVSYKLVSKVPYRPDGAPVDYSFTIKDTMPEGFQLNINDFSVIIGESTNTPLTQGTDYTVTPGTANDFTLNLRIENNDNVGEDITITYSGIVTNDVKNKPVTAESNPGHENKVEGTVNGQSISDSVKFFTASYEIKKVANDTNKTALAGAVFTLSTQYGDETKYYSVDENGDISWVPESKLEALPEGITSTSGAYHVTETGENVEDGVLTFVGLDADKVYTLTEVKAPSGYNLMKGPVVFDFKGDTDTEYQGYGKDLLLAETATEVVNYKGMQLPETGGMGTTLFYIAGGTLVAGAAVLLITKRRMSEAE